METRVSIDVLKLIMQISEIELLFLVTIVTEGLFCFWKAAIFHFLPTVLIIVKPQLLQYQAHLRVVRG